MKYRMLGNTGLKVSEIGLGGHEFRRQNFLKDKRFIKLNPERPKMLRTAYDMGLNYFDTTFQEEVQSLGSSLKKAGINRKSVYITGGINYLLKQLKERDVKERESFIESKLIERLKLLKSDYFDIFMINSIEFEYDTEIFESVIEILKRFINKGYFHHIGASGHDPEIMLNAVSTSDALEVVMFPFNYHNGWKDPKRKIIPENERGLPGPGDKLLKIVQEKNIGFVAMKPFVWFDYGVPFMQVCRKLLNNYTKIKATPAQIALKWILKNNTVSTTIPSANNLNEIVENLKAADLDPDIVNNELLKSCSELRNRIEEQIDLIDHNYNDIKTHALNGVKIALGKDYGSDKKKYFEELKRI